MINRSSVSTDKPSSVVQSFLLINLPLFIPAVRNIETRKEMAQYYYLGMQFFFIVYLLFPRELVPS
jgi:hypothetical protein